MRSTRAATAVERLKQRSGNARYSMVLTGTGLFYLVLAEAEDAPEKLGEALELDDFVKFVNGYGPQTPRRISRLDVAFEKQLARKDK